MRHSLVFFIILILFAGNGLFAKDMDGSAVPTPYLAYSPGSAMKAEMTMAMQKEHYIEMDSSKARLYSHPDYILPKRALFFSVLIPGAGELYCKSYTRSLLFLGIEAGAWTMYAIFNKKGKDKENEFKDFADDPETGWDYDRYNAWAATIDDAIKEEKFTHSIPLDNNDNVKKTQQYYEMIGKYDQFLAGWAGLEDIPLTTNDAEDDPYSIYGYSWEPREEYIDLRHESNKLFKRSYNGIYIAMFNRIFSAIDAAWVAKRHNKTLLSTSLRMENKYFNNNNHTVFTLNVNW